MGNVTTNAKPDTAPAAVTRATPDLSDVPTVLTVPEFADALRVSAATIRNWIAQGTIVTTPHPGRHHRIPRAELDRLMGVKR